MSLNFRKLASLLTSSLLVAGGLVGLAAAPANAVEPVQYDFESLPTGWGGFEGAWASSNEATPSTSDADAPSGTKSGYVQEQQAGGQTWAGINLAVRTTSEFISASSKIVEMKVKVPVGTNVTLKLEDPTNNPQNPTATLYMEKTVQVTTANWTLISFDFGSAPVTGTYTEGTNYLKSALFMNNGINDGVAPTGGDPAGLGPKFYIDDLAFTPNAMPQTLTASSTLIDFTQSTYSFAGFENHSAVLATPPTTGTTCSAAAKVVKANWGPNGLYSVARIASFSDRKLLSSSNSTMTVNMYAPVAGKTVLFKITRAGASAGIEKAVTSTVGWQRVSLDFSTAVNDNGIYNEAWNASAEYTDLFVAVEHTVAGSGAEFYFDDFAFNGATTPALGSSSSCAVLDYDVKLVASQRNTAVDTDQWVDCNGGVWCATNNYYLKMIAAGATTTLNYVVTQHGSTTPVSGAVVRLKMNTGYSGSNATWSTSQAGSGSTFGAVSTSNPNDAGYIEATSNAQGEVSFTFANTNNSGEAPRLLNVANPYPAGCKSPAGQTKGALQPAIQSVNGASAGTQYVDVVWPHITSSTINPSVAFGSDGSGCNFSGVVELETGNKGAYPHIRLEKQFLENNFDASWWDGVYQYRDADTKAYLKYIPVGSTFKLTYLVTDANNKPLANAPVSLIVNANYACAKTFFLYENSLIGPDDCAGGGQTELEPKKTDKQGRVTFVLTNTNETGEAMPADLNGLPNGKELGTNIKPHLVGATTEGIDMLFAHFVEPVEAAKVSAPAEKTLKAGQTHSTTFTFTDEKGAPITATDVSYYVNGFNSKIGFAKTNGAGQVTIQSSNFSEAGGTQTVAVSLARSGKLPLTATSTVNWTSSAVALAVSGGKSSLSVKVTNANGKTVKVNIGGTTYTRKATSDSATFKFATSAGKKKVSVSVGAKSTTKTVTISN